MKTKVQFIYLLSDESEKLVQSIDSLVKRSKYLFVLVHVGTASLIINFMIKKG